MPTRLFLGTDVCPSVFRLPLFTDAERVGNKCPPYLAKSVLQKQEPNNAVADTREWTRITPVP